MIVIGHPSRGMVTIDWHVAVDEMLAWAPPGVKLQTFYVRAKPVDEARRLIAEYAVRQKASHLLFLDDDTYPSPDSLVRLWNARQPVVTGVVYTKSDPTLPMVFRKDDEGPWVDWVAAPKGLHRINAAGLAMTLIAVDVFERLPKPWFAWGAVPQADGGVKKLGEDTWFYERLLEAGVPAFVDTNAIALHGDPVIEDGLVKKLRLYPSKEQTAQIIGHEL